jgi:AraC-like DNA-binding protein
MTIFLKSKNENISLTELAYESAYYDQSHFISDFRKMTGLTPKQFFNDCELSISNFFE